MSKLDLRDPKLVEGDSGRRRYAISTDARAMQQHGTLNYGGLKFETPRYLTREEAAALQTRVKTLYEIRARRMAAIERRVKISQGTNMQAVMGLFFSQAGNQSKEVVEALWRLYERKPA